MGWLRPDGKSQVTIEYVNERPVGVHAVVDLHPARRAGIASDAVTASDIIEQVIRPVHPQEVLDDEIIFHINPTGQFVVGGPHGDTGLTGRKIIVDSYGGHGADGGGAFWARTRRRSTARPATGRYIAKNIVKAGLAERREVQLAYAIGVARPGVRHRHTEGTAVPPDADRELVTALPADPPRIINAWTCVARSTRRRRLRPLRAHRSGLHMGGAADVGPRSPNRASPAGA